MIGSIDTYGISEIYYLRNAGVRTSEENSKETTQNSEVQANRITGDTSSVNSQSQDMYENQSNGSKVETKDEKGENKNNSQSGGELTEDQKREVEKLKETDKKVRAHEMAHLAAAGGIAVSGANFQYKRGPDGVNYAVGGEVSIDTSKEKDPQQTISKAQKIVSAALAPADPSPQDRKVASQARAMESQARSELAVQQQSKSQPTLEPSSPQSSTSKESSQTSSSDSTTAATATTSGNSGDTIPHPGINVYRQNQSYANGMDNYASLFSPNNKVGTNIAASLECAPQRYLLDLMA